MINKIFEYLKKPELYAESTSKFWDDQHISKELLEAHLHPTWDAASRNHDFIHSSVEWISDIAPSKYYKKLLDLGCGPGLYAERFYKKGYTITAMDFSKRSINYGKEKAKENHSNIQYIYGNYLQIDYDNEFDLVTLIFCDYGALSHLQRRILLKKIYGAMKSGGKFIFDVFTPKNYQGKMESTTWYFNEGSGFWKEDTYLSIEAHYIYEGNIRLNQSIVIDKEDNISIYRIWDHYYTKYTISEELKQAGFKKIQIFSDVAGKPYDEESKTMCIMVEK